MSEECTGRWTAVEQAAFIQGLNESGRNWKHIAQRVTFWAGLCLRQACANSRRRAAHAP
jgi:hypothetical protein